MLALLLCIAQTSERIHKLGSDDFDERERATEALVDAGEEALPLLQGALQSHDLEVAARARLILLRRRSTFLRGIGVVVGLNGTGDSPGGETEEALKNILGRVVGKVDSRNAAIVAVTALISSSDKPGTTIDVQVTAVGDAASIAGGTLFLTPLRSLRGKPRVMGLAQGRIVVEHDSTNGTIRKGMIVELSPAP